MTHLLCRHEVQHLPWIQTQDGGQVLLGSGAWIQLFSTLRHQQTPLHRLVELHKTTTARPCNIIMETSKHNRFQMLFKHFQKQLK